MRFRAWIGSDEFTDVITMYDVKTMIEAVKRARWWVTIIQQSEPDARLKRVSKLND